MVAEMASFIFELSQLGDAVREKTGLCGKNSQSGGALWANRSSNKKCKSALKSGMVPKSQEWWQGIWNINLFRQSLKITSDILRYIRYSALQCHLAAAFCFIINVAWFIFSDLSSDARTSSCLYFKRYIIYGQNSQSQVFQQNNLLKSCIGSLVKSENCNRTASPPDLAHCAPLTSAWP